MSARYLLVEDIAAGLGMSHEWVRRQCNNGALVATKVGRSWRIAEHDYEAFMRKYRGGATPPSRVQPSRRGRRRVA